MGRTDAKLLRPSPIVLSKTLHDGELTVSGGGGYRCEIVTVPPMWPGLMPRSSRHRRRSHTGRQRPSCWLRCCRPHAPPGHYATGATTAMGTTAVLLQSHFSKAFQSERLCDLKQLDTRSCACLRAGYWGSVGGCGFRSVVRGALKCVNGNCIVSPLDVLSLCHRRPCLAPTEPGQDWRCGVERAWPRQCQFDPPHTPPPHPTTTTTDSR